ncbi:probable helicase senataxin isoform X2 [Hypomesus transpacificus]|uniref:probable helicase senataxin isoform X2 n=1 Tax=Hypomesus transpacificus TaxID=137520 RepID=UPI001F07BF53|nr:probable helicase senataxin isoform X2 [Hypomesus transpacificus]
MMSTCRWCTSVENGAAELLQSYGSGSLSVEDEEAVNADLCFCNECVLEYHKARENFPALHKRLWELETSRLVSHFSQFSEEELEDDDLWVIEDNQEETKVSKTNPAEYANLLRFPLLEILKYPYLMAHRQLSEMCVEALCKMEKSNQSFQVTEKNPGIYLLLVHPNETVRRWAINVARSLGNVDRDDFYDLQEIFSCMFCVVELGISRNLRGIDITYDPTTKMTMLPSHLYDSKNDKNYWLGICMLLTQLDTQAMDSLFLGPDKQANILQCILNTMKNSMEDEEEDGKEDPFWPALQCFMVILDRLGSRIWGQIDPIPAFTTITESASYMKEIECIRKESQMAQVKVEFGLDDDDDDSTLTCSQMVYCANVPDRSKEKRGRRSYGADGSMVYEEMNCLVNYLQSDLGQALRIHNSTFLWFIPFVKSIMDLIDLNNVHINEVIQYLYGEMNRDWQERRSTCDKVSEFFTLILIYIINLHLESGCMNMLFYCAPNWVEVLVKTATLPGEAFKGLEVPSSHSVSSTSSSRLAPPRKTASNRAIPQACMGLIRALLKEGSKLCSNTPQQTAKCSHFLDLLNQQMRGPQKDWILNGLEVKHLQNCLKQFVRQMMDKPARTITPPAEALNAGHASPPVCAPSDLPGPSGLIVGSRPIKEEVSLDYNEYAPHNGSNRSAQLLEAPSLKTEFIEVPVTAKDISASPPIPEMSSLRPDLGRILELKSKLSELMSNKNAGVKNSMAFERRSRDETGSPKPSTSNSDRTRTEVISPPADSTESESVDDTRLSVLKRTNVIAHIPPGSGHKLDRSVFNETREDVIVISDGDTDVESEEDLFFVKQMIKSKPSGMNHSPCCEYEGDESQVFEFETQEDVVSAWADSGLEDDNVQQVVPPKTKNDCPVRPAFSETSAFPENDTQPISDEDIERAMLEAEEGIAKEKRPPQDRKRATIVPKNDIFVEPKPLPVIARSKKPDHEERRSKVHAMIAPQFTMPLPKTADHTSDSTWKEREAQPSLSKPTSSRTEKEIQASSSSASNSRPAQSTSMPAIVPPKKVRKAKEPESTAEKLGLKKKERKAFDLSQRSRDYVDQLRLHGQGVQVEPAGRKRTRKTKKAKVRTSDTLVVPGTKRKLIPPKQLQFFRQAKSKQQGSGSGTPAIPGENAEEDARGQKKKEPERRALPLMFSDEEDEDDPLPCSQPDPEKEVSKAAMNGNAPESTTTLSTASSSTDIPISKYVHGKDDATASSSGQAARGEDMLGNDNYDYEWMLYTQTGTTDMEMSSQMEENEDGFYTQRDPVDMDIDGDSQEAADGEDPPGHLQADPNHGFKKPSAPPSATAAAQNDERLFLKPGMSPMSSRNAKPSTTKIYASTSRSRSASLVQEMEKTAAGPAGCASGRGKFIKPPQPVRRPGVPQPHPPPQAQSVQMPPSRQPLYKSIPPRTFPLGSIQVPQPVQPQSSPYKIYSRPEAPVIAKQAPPRDPNILLDPSTPIQNILRWTYDMFTNYKQFGAPTDLCAFPLVPVGTHFKSFDEYYKTFYPLLLINAFEELCSDWQKNSGTRQMGLNLVGNDFRNGVWNVTFKASLTPIEESRQLYPKEDDLVVLWLPQNTGAYAIREQEQMEPKAYFGCVHKSNVLSEGQSTILTMIIKTCGNVTSVNKMPVRCEVVGSLISTLREFRALVSLKSSPLNRSLLAPQISYFTPGELDGPALNLAEYNSEQLKAVRNGASSVRNQAKGPKVCLIHGPPGTGKSKAIVGLLMNLFSGGAQSMAPTSANRLSKPRRLRVLLCAPSNAAIDNLMKKVIVAFKQKHLSLGLGQRPQGNCGDINLVRLGSEKVISKKLADFSLDNQIKSRTEKAMLQNPDVHRRRAQLEDWIYKISLEISCEKAANKDSPKYRELVEKKTRLANERQALSSELKQSRSRKQEMQARVLNDAHVICSTLSTSGSMVLESAFRRLGHEPFNCVIVDEAGQATETETLIPMLYRCSTLILVGDPNQLPPTVVSQKAKELDYSQSLMARLCQRLSLLSQEQGCPSPVVFLRKQYRMHPDICEFPSKHIYNKMLLTDSATGEERCAASWPFQPYLLFDVADGQEVKDRESFCNEKEARLVLLLLRLMNGHVLAATKKQAGALLDKKQVKVGVITPYNGQKERVRREMTREDFGYVQVVVDTVDGFQGQEMDCIIVSCVRAGQDGIGFLANRQRMNVTITRARCSLFILGHLRTLKGDSDWGALINDASRRGTIVRAEEKAFNGAVQKIFKPSPSLARNLSYLAPNPSSQPEAPRPASVSQRRSTYPVPSAQASGLSLQQHPSDASPPQVVARPTDPRLAARVPKPPDQKAQSLKPPSARLPLAPQALQKREEASPRCPPPPPQPRVEALRETGRDHAAVNRKRVRFSDTGQKQVKSTQDISSWAPSAGGNSSSRDPRAAVYNREAQVDGCRTACARDPAAEAPRRPRGRRSDPTPRGDAPREPRAGEARREPATSSPSGGEAEEHQRIRPMDHSHERGSKALLLGAGERDTHSVSGAAPPPAPGDRTARDPRLTGSAHNKARSPHLDPPTHATKGLKRSLDQHRDGPSSSKRAKR